LDRVGGVMLTRQQRVAQVRVALDGGRYVEIRGDAGVGKSGVLKHFAEQISGEAQAIVLSPSRTVPRGWLALPSVRGFDGTTRDLLPDIAGDGSAVLLVDNLDFFDDEERLTVIDLLRRATKVPGMAVIVTARRDFGVAEPCWLPADVINQLGRAELSLSTNFLLLKQKNCEMPPPIRSSPITIRRARLHGTCSAFPV
jgi:hypothetical protein